MTLLCPACAKPMERLLRCRNFDAYACQACDLVLHQLHLQHRGRSLVERVELVRR